MRFARKVAAELVGGGFTVAVEPSIKGLRPDFLVTLGNGRQVVLEAKAWEPNKANIKRAAYQADFYRREIGVPAFVVVPGAPGTGKNDVIGISNLVACLNHLSDTGLAPEREPVLFEAQTPVMFCAMPFAAEYDDVYLVAMSRAAESNGLAAQRVDHQEFTSDIVDYIHESICKAAVVVADLSGSLPNVLYELGYAIGVRRPVVTICSTELQDLPFDVAHRNTIGYRLGQTHALANRLVERVAAALSK